MDKMYKTKRNSEVTLQTTTNSIKPHETSLFAAEHPTRKHTTHTNRAFNSMKNIDDSLVSITSLKTIHCQNITSIINNPHVRIHLTLHS